jgi:sugar phosphate isomerase/epimerase
MKITRREFIQVGAAAAGAVALKVQPALGIQGGNPMLPAINPVYLMGGTGVPPVNHGQDAHATSPMQRWPLEQLAETGYRGLELTPACLDDASTAAWKPVADKAGLEPVCVNALPELRPYLTGSLSDAVERNRRATLDRLLRVLEQMRRLQISLLVVAPGRPAENYQTPAEARALLIASLRELADAGDTTILLEAAPWRMFASSKEIAAVVDEVGKPNVAAALDLGHALLNGESPSEASKTLGARLRYVQVHDADISPGSARLDRHLPLGEGSLKREEVREMMRDLPFAVGITPLADPLSAAKAALEWLGSAAAT